MGKMPAASNVTPPYNLRNYRQRIERRTRRQVAESRIDPRLGHDDCPANARHCLAAMMRLAPRRGDILLAGPLAKIEGFPVRKRDGGINFSRYFLPTYEVTSLIAKSAFRLRPKANAMAMFGTFPKRAGTLTPPPSRWNWLKGASKLPMSRPCSIPF